MHRPYKDQMIELLELEYERLCSTKEDDEMGLKRNTDELQELITYDIKGRCLEHNVLKNPSDEIRVFMQRDIQDFDSKIENFKVQIIFLMRGKNIELTSDIIETIIFCKKKSHSILPIYKNMANELVKQKQNLNKLIEKSTAKETIMILLNQIEEAIEASQEISTIQSRISFLESSIYCYNGRNARRIKLEKVLEKVLEKEKKLKMRPKK